MSILRLSCRRPISVFMLRCLRKQEYQQPDVDYVFRSSVLPKLTNGLPVYTSSKPELTTVQNFLQRSFKRKSSIFSTKLTYIRYQKRQIAHYSRRSPVCPVTLCTLPSPKRKKVQRSSEFLAVNSLRLIPSVLKIAFLIGQFSNIEQLFNVMCILNVKFNAFCYF